MKAELKPHWRPLHAKGRIIDQQHFVFDIGHISRFQFLKYNKSILPLLYQQLISKYWYIFQCNDFWKKKKHSIKVSLLHFLQSFRKTIIANVIEFGFRINN